MLMLLLNDLGAAIRQSPIGWLATAFSGWLEGVTPRQIHLSPYSYRFRWSPITRLGQLILLVLWFFIVPPVWAADSTSSLPALDASAPLPAPVDAADIPSDQVNQFVDAYLQVATLIDARSEDLKRAATEAESLQLQQTIQADAYALIEATGLTLPTYWQLLGLANSDVEFRDRVLAQLEERDH
jgi:hypothetical protein